MVELHDSTMRFFAILALLSAACVLGAPSADAEMETFKLVSREEFQKVDLDKRYCCYPCGTTAGCCVSWANC